MKCPDCKGTGIYQGLGAPENCQTCGGLGMDTYDDKSKDEVQWPGGVDKKHWEALRDLYQKQGIRPKGQKIDIVGAASKAGMSPKQICEDADKVTSLTRRPTEGETVHVYDTGWYEAEIINTYDSVRGPRMVRADHSCGIFRIPLEDICWNVTEQRWEHIRCGTPVW